MKKTILIILLLTVFSFFLCTQVETIEKTEDNSLDTLQNNRNLDEPIVKYLITAQLLPKVKKLEASEILTWINKTDNPISNLRFHLYYNAFRNIKSTFLKEAGFGKKSKRYLNKLKFGEIKIKEMRIINGEELYGKIRYISPDDQNEYDRTVIEINLEEPVQPYQSITIKIGFVLTIPKIIARTGFADDYFFFGQWFPKIGVLQNDGEWNCHQFHRHSEFFADYGEYKVDITIPENFIIGATGNLIKKEKNVDKTITYFYEEKNIHDFAWTASPEFKKIVEKIKLKGNDENTTIELLLSPFHSGAKQRYLNSIKFALNFFAENIFPYPYKKITIVDPPLKGMRSAGMEYPTLITAGYSKLVPDSIKFTELVTIHEFGHQYWYGMIGTDEFREAWLDEGVNTFFEMEILDAYFKNSSSFIASNLININDWERNRLSGVSLLPVDKINQYSWKFLNGSYYSDYVYSKASTLLRSLKNYVGKKKMYDFFKFYAQKFKFKHPKTEDFINTFNEFMDKDFSWAFDQFINGSSNLDNSVFMIESKKIDSNPVKYRNEAIFTRNEGYFPVELLIKLKNGKDIKYFWEEKEKWKKIVFYENSPIDYAVVDPDFKILLDKNLINNSKILNPKRTRLRTIASKLGFLFQNILSLLVM